MLSVSLKQVWTYAINMPLWELFAVPILMWVGSIIVAIYYD